MLKSITILLSVFIGCLLAQRYGNQNFQQQPSHYPASSAADAGLVDEFGQCDGLNYEGPKTCRSSLTCFKRSKYYSQCLTSEAVANASKPLPQTIPTGGKCHGGNLHGPTVCETGTACFIQAENIHGECRTYCPQGWFCAKQTLPEWAPCGGEGYVGLTKCKEGLQCIVHSKWYHECRAECPEGWKC